MVVAKRCNGKIIYAHADRDRRPRRLVARYFRQPPGSDRVIDDKFTKEAIEESRRR